VILDRYRRRLSRARPSGGRLRSRSRHPRLVVTVRATAVTKSPAANQDRVKRDQRPRRRRLRAQHPPPRGAELA